MNVNGIAINKMTLEEARQCADEIKLGISNIGQRLLQLYEGDGWKVLGYSSWRECAQVEFGFKQSHVYRLLDSAEVVRNIENSPIGENVPLPTAESQSRPLTKLDPVDQPVAWQRAVETAPNGKVTAAHVEATAKTFLPPNATPLRLQPIPANGFVSPRPAGEVIRSEMRFVPAKPFSELEAMADESESDEDGYDWTKDSVNELDTVTITDAGGISDTEPGDNLDSDEYYTPIYIIDAALSVLGDIDLDPATCEKAQHVINASNYYTKQDDGLNKSWHGRVWLNPPFSKPHPFVFKLIDEYETGNVEEAIILVNNGTETKWGQALLARYPVCFVGASDGRGSRISFWNQSPDQPEKGNRYAQMIFYLGVGTERFTSVFSQFGVVKK